MDVDIDIQRKIKVDKIFSKIVRASRVDGVELKKHNVGVYFQSIPKDDISGLSAIPYKSAEELGYLKVDFLTLDMLDYFADTEQIRGLVSIDPDWSLLEKESNVINLFQIKNHFKLINMVKPRDIETLADCLALIRPGKRYLLDQYIKDKYSIRSILYTKNSGYIFKRSHAIAYATNIVLQLHLLKGGILDVIE